MTDWTQDLAKDFGGKRWQFFVLLSLIFMKNSKSCGHRGQKEEENRSLEMYVDPSQDNYYKLGIQPAILLKWVERGRAIRKVGNLKTLLMRLVTQ